MQVELCRHIKSNGIQCHAVALRDEDFCYFHKRLNHGHSLYRSTMVGKKRLMDRGFIIGLPPLEDRVSVQLALSEVINALACNFIDSKRANALFFGLKLAAANAKDLEAFPEPTAVVRDYTHAPDLLENIAVDLAPAGRTCEIEEFAEATALVENPTPKVPAPPRPSPMSTAVDDEPDPVFEQEFKLELQTLMAEAKARLAKAEADAARVAAAGMPSAPAPDVPSFNEELDLEFKALFAEPEARSTESEARSADSVPATAVPLEASALLPCP